MKKIYILTAVFALLTLSLNAQNDGNLKEATGIRLKARTVTDAKDQAPTMNELLRGIKGMSSVLQATNDPNGTSGNGQMRAPLKINSDEELVGPYTTNDFSTSGLGFPDVYGGNSQQAYIFTDLNRADFEDYDGRELVGFRFALAGNSSQTAVLYDFMAWPYGASGYFEAANRHTWSIPEVAGVEPVNTFDDIVITVPSYYSMFRSITVYGDNNTVLSSWNADESTVTEGSYTYYELPSGWELTSGGAYMFQMAISNVNYGYPSSGSESVLTIDGSLMQGQSSARVVIEAICYSGTSTVDVNGDTRNLTTTASTNTWNFSPTTTTPIYMELQCGQWHEFYLDEPITFNVTDTVTGMYLGYRYWQWGSSSTGEFMYPIAVNPNSTSHDHVSYMTKQYGTSTFYDDVVITANSYSRIYSISVMSGTSTITSFSYNTDGSTLPEGWGLTGSWSIDNNGFLYTSSTSNQITIDGDLLQGYSNVSVVINFKSSSSRYTAYTYVNGSGQSTSSTTASNKTYSLTGTTGPAYYTRWWTESFNGDLAVQLIFKNDNKTPAPVITYVVNGDNVVITATGQGTVTLNIPGYEPATGTGSASITVPRTDTTYSVTATATAQDGDKDESDPTIETITVPFLQTDKPVITYETVGESVVITATGDGTVTLNVPGYEPATGDGSASITVPCGVVATTVTATATAKEEGKAESETETAQVPIPAGEGWIQMYGDYDNPNTLLSFETLEQEDIMLIDQFLASTKFNTHPNGYTYTLRETIDGEEKGSTPVSIPVYKTSSTMQGLYTKNQVDYDDLDMSLTAQAINSEMDYGVNPDHNTLYHSLYRGGVEDDYPVIDVQHRVSQLQKYEENVNDNVQFFFKEMHNTGVTPKYDQVGNEVVEPLDINYLTGDYNDEISYVPVIWTFGLYTGRDKGDGKNNSYGSDIKREKLGDVNIISIAGSKSGGNNAENTGNGWEGQFYVGDELYCIYTPIITIEGICPETLTQNDGDVSEYEPYMFRAWCLYDGARYFNNNAQGILIDGGPRQAPFLLGQVQVPSDVNRVTIGSEWQNGQGPLQWAFAVPVSTLGSDIQFAVRFYYKKKVTDAQAANTLRGNRDGEGGDDAEYYIVQETGDGGSINTAISEFLAGKTIVGQTYVNAQGMQSSKPFDGLNIVITRYSDGTTSTTKVIR